MAFIPNPVLANFPFEAIPSIRTVFDAMKVLRKTSDGFGFRYFFVMALPTGISGTESKLSRMTTLSSWPRELTAGYDELGLGRKSPLLEVLRKRITPVMFDVDTVNTDRPATEAESASKLFSRFGLTMGICFPVHDTNGNHHAVSFVGDRSPLTAVEVSTLSMFATMLIEQVSRIMDTDSTSKSDLNEREAEVLRWTAEGKTSAEIAGITGPSENTVNHYATIATQKLGCANRTQALLHPIRLGPSS